MTKLREIKDPINRLRVEQLVSAQEPRIYTDPCISASPRWQLQA